MAVDDRTAEFEEHRARLRRLAERILHDAHEAEDVVQNTWLRLQCTHGEIYNLPAWLTTATTRLCLDRLRARVPVYEPDAGLAAVIPDATEQVVLAETVGVALQILLDRLTPNERVAFVLHDTFGFDFSTIAEILGRTPVATRKLASRARGKIDQQSGERSIAEVPADWQVVDAFLAASRNGDFTQLLELLDPAIVVEGDTAAVALGTPARLEGADVVAKFFNGAARAALPVFVETRPGAAWILRGETKVAFDFTLSQGRVQRIDFRADPGILAQVQPRRDGSRQ